MALKYFYLYIICTFRLSSLATDIRRVFPGKKVNIAKLCFYYCCFIISGCASVAVQTHSNHKPELIAKAAVIDLVTLPIQIIAAPVIYTSAKLDEQKRQEAQQKRIAASKVHWYWVKKIRLQPLIVVNGDFLNKDSSSSEYKALDHVMKGVDGVSSIDTKFPASFYIYFYQNIDSTSKSDIYLPFFRNTYIPEDILIDAYHKVLNNLLPSRYIFAILNNKNLPFNLLKNALSRLTNQPPRYQNFAKRIVTKRIESELYGLMTLNQFDPLIKRLSFPGTHNPIPSSILKHTSFTHYLKSFAIELNIDEKYQYASRYSRKTKELRITATDLNRYIEKYDQLRDKMLNHLNELGYSQNIYLKLRANYSEYSLL